MKVSRAQSEENRVAVISAAARLFRERGFDGIGLAELMGAAGLTQGGFYNKFKSKEDLVAQACGRALEASLERSLMLAGNTVADPFAAFIGGYLSVGHRDSKGEGCALAALACDAARSGPAVRGAFEAGISAHLEILDDLLAASPDEKTRDASISSLSAMMGGLLLSRVVEDETLSLRILNATAQSLIGRMTNDREAVVP